MSKKNNKSFLEKAQEIAARRSPPASFEFIASNTGTGGTKEMQPGDIPEVPIEYVKGKPQINEMGVLFTGLIDKMPNGPKTDEKGSSPIRQKRIIQQASRKIEKRRLINGNWKEGPTP